jgi:hypothetical protein
VAVALNVQRFVEFCKADEFVQGKSFSTAASRVARNAPMTGEGLTGTCLVGANPV